MKWVSYTMTTFEAFAAPYVHPFVDHTTSLTLVVTRIPPARCSDEPPSASGASNMAVYMW